MTCDDGLFCNGTERCAPDDPDADENGCVLGSAPCEDCDEDADSCGDCADADGDGAADAMCGGTDCDDTDPEVFPGATEVCDGSRDEDCDPATLGPDADGDGYVDESCCNGDTCGLDCDDTVGGINPEAVDACGGGDEDCDGEIDENPSETFYRDRDGDGFGVPDDTLTACSAPSGYATLPTDCDDDQRNVNPSTPEVCDGTVDEDCDSRVDEGCACSPIDSRRPCGSDTAQSGVGVCRAGTQTCGMGGWGDCVDVIEPGPEECNADMRDENCDGRVDEGCDCINGTTRRCGMDAGACRSVLQTCVAGRWPRDCDDEPGVVSPRTETCDGALDEDCDSIVDEGCACSDGSTRNCGIDTGACEFGTQTCSSGAWGSCVGGVGPTTETCNGVDQDCDGVPDNADLDIAGVGATCGSDTGECTRGTQSCNGSMLVCSGRGPTAEVCDHENDDCDGRTDEGRWQPTCTTDTSGSGFAGGFTCLPASCTTIGTSRIRFNYAEGDTVVAAYRTMPSPRDWAAQYQITGHYVINDGPGAALFGVMLTPDREGGTVGNWGMPVLDAGDRGYAVMYNSNLFFRRVEIWELRAGNPVMVAMSATEPDGDCWVSNSRPVDVQVTMSTNVDRLTGTVVLNGTSCTDVVVSVSYTMPNWTTQVYGDDSSYPTYYVAAVGGSRDATTVNLDRFFARRTRPLSFLNYGFCDACPW